MFPETGGGDLIAPTPDGEPVHKLSLHFVAGFTILSRAWMAEMIDIVSP